jgi:hypothetical protein
VAFEWFVQWPYFQTLPSDIWEQDLYGISDIPAVSLLFILWILADKLLVAEFKACVMQKIFEQHTEDVEFTSDEVMYCWANTPPSSKLREFMLDHLVANWTDPQLSYALQVDYNGAGWLDVFAEVPDVRNVLLVELAQAPEDRRKLKSLEAYLDDEKEGDMRMKS